MSKNIDLKRKRPVGAPRRTVSKQKRLKRAAAYHSSSEAEEDDALDVNNADATAGDVPEHDSGIHDGSDGIELGNFGNAQRDTREIISKTRLDIAGDEDDHSDDGSLDSEADLDFDADNDAGSDADDGEFDSDEASNLSTNRQRPKRADPQAFATSIDRILNSKLTTTKRADPVLSRSKAAQQTVKEQAESKLEEAARRKLRADKHAKREQGRVKDVLALQSSEVSTGDVIEEEKRLKRLAQKGVVKLFNAVRAAQVTAFEADAGAKKQGMIGIDRRKEKVDEMSKKGFLDLLSGGGGDS